MAKLQQTVQALAARFEARFNEVEMGSDVKVGCGWEWVGAGGLDDVKSKGGELCKMRWIGRDG